MRKVYQLTKIALFVFILSFVNSTSVSKEIKKNEPISYEYLSLDDQNPIPGQCGLVFCGMAFTCDWSGDCPIYEDNSVPGQLTVTWVCGEDIRVYTCQQQ
ncbi:hypothetical protein [uncultured Roseivirga sp.]|uniref:hypothetical protein n=1 Tax=uncultured Roseivirga sp. TaxID=543088 RepID=UPI0030DA90D7|tara:strand:+ start:79923 stop:80222 length:300 start_codon:yes stop_codon:yes gene_type:complete